MGVYVPYTTTTTTGAADPGPDFRIQNRTRDPLCCALVHIPTRCCGSAARSGQGAPGWAAQGPGLRPPHAPANRTGSGSGLEPEPGPGSAFWHAMDVRG